MDSSAPDARARTADFEPGTAHSPQSAGRPSMSDYWSDAPHRLGPAPDPDHRDPATPAGQVRDPFWLARGLDRQPGPDAGPVRDAAAGGPTTWCPRLRQVVAAAAAVLLLVVAGAVLADLVRGDTDRPARVIAGPSPARSATGTPPAEPVPPLEIAGAATLRPSAGAPDRLMFELASSLGRVTVRTGDLGDDLVRVRTRDGVRPRLTRSDGRVRLTLTRGGTSVAAAAEITLDDRTRWTVRVGGGAAQGVLDLTRSAPAAVELAGGGARIDLRLPAADGVLPVRVIDGVNQLRLRTPARVPVRFRARAGAGRVDLYGATRTGIARGDIVSIRAGRRAAGRIEVDATGGLGSLTVTAT